MKRYGKFITDDQIEAMADGPEYDDARLRSMGFYPIVETNEMPDAPNWETTYELFGETEAEKVVLQTYIVPPKPPRTFSKLKLLEGAAHIGKAGELITILQSDPLLYELWSAAQNISEDNEFFQNGIEAIKARMQLSDEQIESVLAASVI